MIDQECQHCQGPVNRMYAIFCSRKCSNASYYLRKKSGSVGLLVIKCKNCNNNFQQKKSTQFCCSKNCSSALWRRTNMTPENRRKYAIKHLYGITQEQWNAMYENQLGLCKICQNPLATTGRGIATDHCHTSGTVRGILCTECNLGLGYFKDSPETMRRAAEYIENDKKLEEFYG